MESESPKLEKGRNEAKPAKRKLSDTNDDKEFLLPTKLVKLENEDGDIKNKGKKHVRKRLKFLLQAVLDQMEFYFSDSNLSKDRYLKKLVEQSPDGYIDLAVFGNFNKLQMLHKDGVSLKILAKALGQSKVLQLNENKTRVRRLTPFKEISAEETDNRTVYVEYLPKHATHAWIQTTFAACGKVMYVSLPKYPSTKEIKGFAFVEFQTAEEAEKACNMLNNPPPAREGDKPGRFPRGNKTLDRLQKIVPPKQDQDNNEENIAEEAKGEPSRKKKKKTGSRKKQAADTSLENESQASAIKSAELAEGKKKKKKKKKKKQGSSLDESYLKDEDSLVEGREGDEAVAGESKEIPSSEKAHEKEEKTQTQSEPTETEESLNKKKKKKKKKKKGRKLIEEDVSVHGDNEQETVVTLKQPQKSKDLSIEAESSKATGSEPIGQSRSGNDGGTNESAAQVLSRRERKLLRQQDIRRKKKEREEQELAAKKESESGQSEIPDKSEKTVSKPDDIERSKLNRLGSDSAMNSETAYSDTGDWDKGRRKSDGSELTSILKTKRPGVQKKVEFDPVPVTQEFVREKEIRKRKKAKKDKLQLRVISKKEWLSLKAEYLNQQKSHMTALKESLRELRQQENQSVAISKPGSKHVDLEDVFGTKRLKPSQDVKMAHVESLKFTPDVIVQWTSTNEMHRDKIRTMFKDIGGDSIAYIDALEEAKTGYIRFKDAASAAEFAKLSRHTNTFTARPLPAEQQQQYWDRANADRMKKLGRKKQEKGSQRIARKVFERNKTTFHEKPSRICFKDDSDEENENESLEKGQKEESPKEVKESTEKPESIEAASS